MAATEIVNPPAIDEDLAFLRSTDAPALMEPAQADIATADLFAGCGGLTVGAIEGALRGGRTAAVALAVDHAAAPLKVLRRSLSLPAEAVVDADLEERLGDVGAPTTADELALLERALDANVLLAGPPCQGHSALNNHTRHDDPRNDLYLKVARAAELISPDVVIVENVRGVCADKREAVSRCAEALRELGYQVTEKPIDLRAVGAAQRRIRHVLVATMSGAFLWDELPESPQRSVGWAIEDLLGVEPSGLLDTASNPSPENLERMQWLITADQYDLPNPMRPDCHQNDEHSYKSMYGRLNWDAPAQTITTGFGSMGQGRFVHPRFPRTITPHEAARVQFLPDYLRLGDVEGRGALARMIGNAAPPALTIALVQSVIDQGLL